ncbi:MAG: PrsW family intramembrane metalloprotease [bacterium]|nr:PrsW family intramembrane metalloprotease [bacterium]
MSYPLYIIFGVLPSIVWLLFYLRRDTHPESNKMILKIFFYGMIAALPAILLELGISDVISGFNFSTSVTAILTIFIAVAFTEELLKYLVVSGKVLKSSELDEPIDIMLYMIIAALGFAASENILIMFSMGPAFLLNQTFSTSVFRFLGATLLHTLSSGLLGFFLAISVCKNRGGWKIFLLGLALAVFLHGLYNFAIIELEGDLVWQIPSLILFGLAIFTTFSIRKLKQLKSVCKM